ncbi:hypothetical protein [Tahibacter amnicola]|uniref:Transmembrane protein n=1 Tax=Tahibacter amnicola TaxID=2976241 RepID=A0ABY6BKB8_9GAMM|nr:hypothetical protein [Tahibacter amnicola]UXI68830.1 hypothetical protein N4264_04015 [Tahibacter amnicola]
MSYIAGVASVALLVLAVWGGIINLVAVLLTRAAARRGLGRVVSPVPLLVQLLAGAAALVASLAGIDWLPQWLFWTVALADVALWGLFASLFAYLASVRRVAGR